jgi:collagenase-like PrtC family protease
MPRPHLELLAPAKSADIGIEAVNHGADAIYIGGPAFGARAAAGNDVQDIERLCRHAHRYGARIFITLNTILRDDELEPARRMAWQVYEAGADALIVQDMGLLEIDLPPIQLHASTQSDIRSVEKARFLQDVGFSQMVLARELDLPQIRAIAAQVQHATLEFFIHGALCVAYSGQCYLSHAHTGRSANRGDCSQPCRLPYTVTDANGGIVAHGKHVLSMKDNNQSGNLRALIDAGIRSFKIEGRYKDMGYVKNLTAHYRRLLDEILEERSDLQRASSGRCSFAFTPDPDRNFNRESTDYFVNGRQDDIGAFDTPKHAGLPVGHVLRVGADHFDVALDETTAELNNGDGLTYFDLQKELVGVQVNTAQLLDRAARHWRVVPNEPIASYKDLRRDVALSRNRDMAWDRLLGRKSADRRIGARLAFTETASGFALTITDEDGNQGRAEVAHAKEPAQNAARADAALREHLGKLGTTVFEAKAVTLQLSQPWFLPAGMVNALRRDAAGSRARRRAGPAATRAAGGAAGALPRRHAQLPGQRAEPSRARLLHPPRREGGGRRVRGARGNRRGEPDDHQALRALVHEPVPQAGQGRDRRAGHRARGPADHRERLGAADLALRLQALRDARGGQGQARGAEPGAGVAGAVLPAAAGSGSIARITRSRVIGSSRTRTPSAS